MEVLKKVGIAVAVVAVLAVLGVLWLRGESQERLNDCVDAMNEWVLAPEGTPQPSILTEDWCVDHLLDEAGIPGDAQP